MKKIIYLALLITTCFLNCSKDEIVTSVPISDVFGAWQVESIQMVQAPTGASPSAVMKQALVPFGDMSASLVGWCNVMFNTDSTWSMVGAITNNAIKIICNAYSSSYTAGGSFGILGSYITFVVTNYSGPSGPHNTGTGTYSLTNNLTINLILANDERWKIVLIKSAIPANINITHTPLPNQYISNWPAIVSTEVTSGEGIHSVWVDWCVNTPSNNFQFNLNNTSGNNYSAPFNSNPPLVQVNDVIYYKIFARDNSSAHNVDSTILYNFNIVSSTNPIFVNGPLRPVNRTTVSGNMFVADQNGNPILGLNANNITARLRWDLKNASPDSVTGTVTLTQATQPNIAGALTMDYSGSMGTQQIQCMENGVRAYINAMNSTDLAEIIKFSTIVQVMQTFTSNKSLLLHAVDSIFTGAGSLTALYQSIYQGLLDAYSISTSQYLRTIIALTDGSENASTVTRSQMISQSLSTGIPVFTITLTTFPTDPAALDMKNIADTTGGFPYVVDPNNCNITTTIYQKMYNILNNAYSITITWPSANLPPSGTTVTAVVYVSYQGYSGMFQRSYMIM